MNDSRSIESCRMVRVWPVVPSRTSWWATRPRRRTEWTWMPPGPTPPRAPAHRPVRVGSAPQSPDAAAMRSAVSMAVPEGASTLASWCSSMISAVSNHGRRQLGEADHEHRADGEVGGDDAAPRRRTGRTSRQPRSGPRSLSPVVPTTGVHAVGRVPGRGWPRMTLGEVKSTTTSTPAAARASSSAAMVRSSAPAPVADAWLSPARAGSTPTTSSRSGSTSTARQHRRGPSARRRRRTPTHGSPAAPAMAATSSSPKGRRHGHRAVTGRAAPRPAG